MSPTITRRHAIGGGLLGAAGLAATLAGCGTADGTSPTETQGATGVTTQQPVSSRVLLAYFSRAGENYDYGGRRFVDVGHTEVLARMIEQRIPCDAYRIEAADPYPTSYDETVERNVREEQDDARPAIARALPDLGRYDTVLLGSPVWNVRAPMIMWSFCDRVRLTGARVLPFVTYAVSEMGSVESDYRSALRDATVGAGLAVRGEEVAGAGADLDRWLTQHGLHRAAGRGPR